jgi:purine nucleosidase
MVLDTDTYNEIDDQYAVVLTMLSPEKFDVEAIYAAPFGPNQRATSTEHGMEQSYDEILRVLHRIDVKHEGLVHKGSNRWLGSVDTPVRSAAVDDMIARAKAPSDRPLYVVAIGAITNVASALLLAPEIADKIVVVWLGGQPYNFHPWGEFNFSQDVLSTQVVYDSGVPFIRVPCINVAQQIKTTLPEMAACLKGQGAIGDYLYGIFAEWIETYHGGSSAASKEIWDLGPIAWLINPGWVETVIVHTPVVTGPDTWHMDHRRHLMREAISVDRDAIFGDIFRKIEEFVKK